MRETGTQSCQIASAQCLKGKTWARTAGSSEPPAGSRTAKPTSGSRGAPGGRRTASAKVRSRNKADGLTSSDVRAVQRHRSEGRADDAMRGNAAAPKGAVPRYALLQGTPANSQRGNGASRAAGERDTQ